MNTVKDITENINTSRVLQDENKLRRIKKEEAHRKGNKNSIFSKLSEEHNKEKFLFLFTNKDNYTADEHEKFWSLFQEFYDLQRKNNSQYNFSNIIFPEDHKKT
ncbi:MAG TPA: hypothetical protein EYG82_02800 [Sulfurovum sp.]|nr:hypothetical protein [Sulfurovum sp.]